MLLRIAFDHGLNVDSLLTRTVVRLQKIRTVELDGKVIKLQIVSLALPMLLLLLLRPSYQHPCRRPCLLIALLQHACAHVYHSS